MKNLKRLFAVALTVIMVLAMATTAFAAETVTNATDHTYDVYQIFAGTQAADDTEGKLAVTDWGSGINGEAFLAALKASDKFGTPNIFADADSAVEVAEALTGATAEQARAFGDLASGHLTGTKAATAVTDGTVNLDAGYYLVVDITSVNGADDAKNVSLLQVTKKGDFEIQKKYDVPTVQKKVKDINDTTDADLGGWQDSADHDIGDAVEFQLTGTLPTNYADYETYFYQFNDTLSEGLTYNNDAKVYVVNGNDRTEVTAQFDLNGAIATITCANLKAITGATITKDSKIVVEYTAILNTKAIIGAEGNPNTVNLEFSNNPNAGGKGDKGKTPDDTVIVFTYKTIVNKVDPNGTPLKGAEFKLYKTMQDGSEVEIEAVSIDENTTTFEFTGLDDGDYVLKETKAPAGYNKVDDIEFTVTAEHEIESNNPELTSLKGDVTTGEITFAANTDEGSLSTDIVNKSGSLLPETGGIGTTLFYVFGAILVIGAGVLLVAKKRMSSSEN